MLCEVSMHPPVVNSYLHDRAARDNRHLHNTPVLATSDQDQQERSENVCESCIERPHNARASRSLAALVVDGGSFVDFGSESGERPLERSSIFARLELLVGVQKSTLVVCLTLHGQRDTMFAAADV